MKIIAIGLGLLFIGSCIICSNPVVRDIIETNQASRVQLAEAAKEKGMSPEQLRDKYNMVLRGHVEDIDEDEPIEVPMVWDGEI